MSKKRRNKAKQRVGGLAADADLRVAEVERTECLIETVEIRSGGTEGK